MRRLWRERKKEGKRDIRILSFVQVWNCKCQRRRWICSSDAGILTVKSSTRWCITNVMIPIFYTNALCTGRSVLTTEITQMNYTCVQRKGLSEVCVLGWMCVKCVRGVCVYERCVCVWEVCVCVWGVCVCVWCLCVCVRVVCVCERDGGSGGRGGARGGWGVCFKYF